MGIIKKLFSKKNEVSEEDLKAEVLRKATAHINAESEKAESEASNEATPKSNPVFQNIDKVKKQNIRAVLLEVAEKGEMGALPISISDKTGVNQQDTAAALASLAAENYVEAVNSATGFKYYITAAGRKYCISKEFNSEL